MKAITENQLHDFLINSRPHCKKCYLHNSTLSGITDNVELCTVNDIISARGAYLMFHIFGRALISKFSKIGIQIFHLHFKIKYHPSIFEKYRIFT